MKTKTRDISRSNTPIMFTVIFVVLLLLFSIGVFVYNFANDRLYGESVSQLQEIGQQLFEKLDVQIELQWSYLEKVEEMFEENNSMTSQEIADLLGKSEKDLSPAGKTIIFRAIDRDGYYYTDEGRQGLWTGSDKLTDDARQSFLIDNSFNNENYMAFSYRIKNSITVDGHKITHLVLLRPMADMQPFFHSSVLGGQNTVYIVDDEGEVLFKDCNLPEIDFEGVNVFSYLKNQNYPHIESLDIILKESWKGSIQCTDVIIQGNRYFLIYARMPDYIWGVMMLVPVSIVAVSATEMVDALLRIFIIVLLILLATLIVAFTFISRIRKNREVVKMMTLKENQLIEINRNLKNAQERTDKALAVAKKATKAKSQFLANMSHDIRTPMNAIMGVSNLMEHTIDNPEKQLYYIKKLQTSGKYMLGLINDILDMSKIESNDVQLNLGPVKLAEQVGQVESIIRSQANEKRQELTVCVHEIAHEYLIGDSIRLRQIFLNLLTNAVKYTPVGGTICFEITELPCENLEYASFRISVIDNGYGMTAEFLEHIFEPFAREVNSTTNKIQGTGLGMSITKSLVDLMGGTITVESELDKGSRFDVQLNLPIDRKAGRATAIGGLLLVSDDEMLVSNVRASLSDTPVELILATNAETAQALLSQKAVDAIMLSGNHSNGTLADTVNRLRKVSNDAVIVFCCDYTHREYMQNTLVGSGVDEIIERPFFLENLVLAVEHVREQRISQPKAHNRSSLNGKRFLCAEDNALNADILEAMLGIYNATCTIYPDGAELVKAFETVKQGDYDAILMDMQMPNMNGIEATQVIRACKNPLGRTIPIIAMTANAFSSDVEKCLNAGMNAHLAKPLDINALERTVHELLENSANSGNMSVRNKLPNKRCK